MINIGADEIKLFSEQIQNDLITDINKEDWRGKDHWWYFSQMAKHFNALDDALTAKSKDDVIKQTINIGSYCVILRTLAESLNPIKKKAVKKTVRKKS